MQPESLEEAHDPDSKTARSPLVRYEGRQRLGGGNMRASNWTRLIVAAALSLEFMRILYRMHADGMPVIGPVGNLLLWLGFCCWQLHALVERKWFRRSLTVLYWVFLASSVVILLRLEVTR